MLLLESTFTKNGFTHTLEARHKQFAVYRRQKGPTPHWETIIVRDQKEATFQTPQGEITMPHREAYPCSEQWGTYGWTYTTKEDAMAKLNQLSQ